MKVLVTGGAGYIGSILVEHLLHGGYDITVVDNFMWGQTSLNQFCYLDRLEIVKGDARDLHLMEPLLKQCDVFIPLAALVGAPLCERNPQEADDINRKAICSAIGCLSQNQRVLYPNTNSGYGTVPHGECTEETPLNSISVYGRTKTQAEEHVLSRRNAVVFRLATVFGMSARMRLDLLVNDFTYRAVMDGFVILYEPHFMRNYIHVRDVARVFMHAIHTKVPDGAYNVGLSTANLSKLDLCREIAKITGGFEYQISKSDRKDPDQRNYVVSNAKIEKSGFLPRFSLQEGIVELMKGFQQFKKSPYGNI